MQNKPSSSNTRPQLHPDGFSRAKTAAALLGLSEATIWRRIADGTLPTVKIGGATLIPNAALLQVAQRAAA